MIDRRQFLQNAVVAAALTGCRTTHAQGTTKPAVRTVLGDVPPERLGVTLMHEHAPAVDWSELYETSAAPLTDRREQMLEQTARRLAEFRAAVPANDGAAPAADGTAAIVECTPIRVGRYPSLMVELARRTGVHIVACTGFWCEAMAPQHPWALRLTLSDGGVQKLAELYIREIRQGMEDPAGAWGERFTTVRAGIIKVATSTWLRPSERRCHEAAAIAAIETGCPITTHTTDGGGWEQAQLLVERGVKPGRVIVGHQGHQDDRQNDEAHELHRRIAGLGCYVQFDRVGHDKYAVDKIARQIKNLVDGGFGERVLVGHDHVPFLYRHYAQRDKPSEGWEARPADFTVAPLQLAKELLAQGVTKPQVDAILVQNPRRVLAF